MSCKGGTSDINLVHILNHAPFLSPTFPVHTSNFNPCLSSFGDLLESPAIIVQQSSYLLASRTACLLDF